LLSHKTLLRNLIEQALLPVPGSDRLQELDALLTGAKITDLNDEEGLPVRTSCEYHVSIKLPGHVLDAVPEVLDE
jgi:hypothetical protein